MSTRIERATLRYHEYSRRGARRGAEHRWFASSGGQSASQPLRCLHACAGQCALPLSRRRACMKRWLRARRWRCAGRLGAWWHPCAREAHA
jgi:hypothetical protein